MPRGPLPNRTRRRNNPPAIPSTVLPVSGRSGPTPIPPESCDLEVAGCEWWDWAWSTPHAVAWSEGDLYVIARRASLEDDLAMIATVDNLDVLRMLDAASENAIRSMVSRLAALASGRLQIMKEMRELDTRLGLTPKGRSDLRWEIADDAQVQEPAVSADRPLEEFTLKQLRALAATRKVDLRGMRLKREVLEALDGATVTNLDDRRRRLTS